MHNPLLALVLFFMLSVFIPAVAHPLAGEQGLATYLEFLTWKGSQESGKTLLEIYGLLDTRYFVVGKIVDQYAVNYGIELKVFDSGGNEVNSFHNTDLYEFPSYEGINQRGLRRFHASVELEPGLYLVHIAARDLNSLASLTTEAEVDVPAYLGEYLNLSSLQLHTGDRNGGPTIDGIVAGNVVKLEAEVYNTDFELSRANRPLSVTVELSSITGRTVFRHQREIQKAGPTTRLSVQFPASPLRNSRYWLQITVLDLDSGQSVSGSTHFDLKSTKPEIVSNLRSVGAHTRSSAVK